jgi:hypothetical protein
MNDLVLVYVTDKRRGEKLFTAFLLFLLPVSFFGIDIISKKCAVKTKFSSRISTNNGSTYEAKVVSQYLPQNESYFGNGGKGNLDTRFHLIALSVV